MNQAGLPVVLMHQSPPRHVDIPIVTIENRIGAQKIVEHLIDVHGCRRIAFLRGPADNEDSREREKGYRQALKSRSIPVDGGLIRTGGYEPSTARAAVEKLIADGLQFDAIFTGDDDNAAGVIEALRNAGRKIPQDVAIAGFDDSLFARILTPPLTTVRAPIELVGQESATQLIRLIQGEPVEKRTVLPVELVIRQSCGCN